VVEAETGYRAVQVLVSAGITRFAATDERDAARASGVERSASRAGPTVADATFETDWERAGGTRRQRAHERARPRVKLVARETQIAKRLLDAERIRRGEPR
jgi:hypothetical protein